MCETPSWRLEFQFLPPTPHKHLYLWSDHHIKSARWWILNLLECFSIVKYRILKKLYCYIFDILIVSFILDEINSIFNNANTSCKKIVLWNKDNIHIFTDYFASKIFRNHFTFHHSNLPCWKIQFPVINANSSCKKNCMK